MIKITNVKRIKTILYYLSLKEFFKKEFQAENQPFKLIILNSKI